MCIQYTILTQWFPCFLTIFSPHLDYFLYFGYENLSYCKGPAQIPAPPLSCSNVESLAIFLTALPYSDTSLPHTNTHTHTHITGWQVNNNKRFIDITLRYMISHYLCVQTLRSLSGLLPLLIMGRAGRSSLGASSGNFSLWVLGQVCVLQFPHPKTELIKLGDGNITYRISHNEKLDSKHTEGMPSLSLYMYISSYYCYYYSLSQS